MSEIITATVSESTTTPTVITSYEASRASRNRVEDLISGGIAVVLISPRPRSGTLELLYTGESDAAAAVELHAEETTFTLQSEDRPTLNMTYVLGEGAITIRLDDETRDLWLVTIPFQQVIA